MATLLPMVEPIYIRVLPMADAWGHPYRVVTSADGGSIQFVSAGADGSFDQTTWGTPSNELPSFNDDAVYSNGNFVRKWAYR